MRVLRRVLAAGEAFLFRDRHELAVAHQARAGIVEPALKPRMFMVRRPQPRAHDDQQPETAAEPAVQPPREADRKRPRRKIEVLDTLDDKQRFEHPAKLVARIRAADRVVAPVVHAHDLFRVARRQQRFTRASLQADDAPEQPREQPNRPRTAQQRVAMIDRQAHGAARRQHARELADGVLGRGCVVDDALTVDVIERPAGVRQPLGVADLHRRRQPEEAERPVRQLHRDLGQIAAIDAREAAPREEPHPEARSAADVEETSGE